MTEAELEISEGLTPLNGADMAEAELEISEGLTDAGRIFRRDALTG